MQAEADFQLVIRARDEILGEDDESSCDARMELARLYMNQNREEMSLSLLDEAIEHRTRSHPMTDNKVIELTIVRYETLDKQGNIDEARECLEQLMEEVIRRHGPNHPTTLFLIENLMKTRR